MNKWQLFSIYMKHVSFSRAWNMCLLWISFRISSLLKKPWHAGLPWTVSIEPTTACNLACPECPSGLKQFTRSTGRLNADEHIAMLDKLPSSIWYINYYFQGEPFLNPGFLSLVREANKRKIFTSTSTNAHFINASMAEQIIDSGLNQLIISIDGLTQETYESYRKHGKLEQVLKATEWLVAAKKKKNSSTPHLIFQFLVVRQNEHEVQDVHRLGREMGVNEVRIKTAQLYDYKDGHPLMPTNPAYSRYRQQRDGSFSLSYKIENRCWRMWSGCVMTWDGKVVPCCFDKDAQHIMGDLTSQEFDTIWRGKTYRQFRQNILKGRSQIDICSNCTEGATVWVD
jgi:radical SAM protein with 4Fe4S-binding SPASM domain